ncbi:MAG: DNA polymerase III subunit beta [Thermodesulfobacteriota bacterium]
MEFIIEKEILTKGLHRVQGIIDKKGTMPMLLNVLIEAKGKEIIITATDLEVGFKESHAAEIKKEGKIGILGKKLFEIVKELPEKIISLKLKENFWVEIKSGKSVFNIMGIDVEKYPSLPSYDEEKDFIEAPNKIINEMINKTIFAVSSDETRKNLLGVFMTQEIRAENKFLRMVATDGYRLSMIDRQIDKEFKEVEKGILLPKKGLWELAKILDEDSEKILISVKNNNFIVKNGKKTLIIRLLDAEFPDYKQVIPEKTKIKISLKRNEFLESLKRVSILSSEKTKGVKFSLREKIMELSTYNPEIGEAKEEILAEYKGEDLIIGFNARFVLEALANFESEEVIIAMEDANSPAIFKPVGDDLHQCIIMPMRF